MRLEVVTGWAELLRPRPVPEPQLHHLFRRLHRGATPVPAPAWTGHEEGPYQDRFLYGDLDKADRRVDLFLEYLEDAVADDALVIVVLPFESYLGSLDGAEPLADSRLRHFIARARHRLGECVTCTRLTLGANTHDVLAKLRRSMRAATAGPAAGNGTAPAGVRSPEPLVPLPEVRELSALTPQGQLDGLQELRSNYTRAVLALGERIVRGGTVFDVTGRSARVWEHLERNELLLRPELGADALMAQLERGGELFELLTHPLDGIDAVPKETA